LSERATPPASTPGDAPADLFENAPCGYLTTGPDGRVERCNATFARWTGLAAAGLIGKPLRDLLTVSGRIFYETNFAPLLQLQGGFEEVALDVVTANGDKLPVLVNAAALRDGQGNVLGARIAIFRAYGRRGYERDLMGREAAAVQGLQDEQAASELREQFIAVLGHDLRNPLASIIGAARLLRREVQSEKAIRVLQLMEASVDRMAGLIDDVMDFARGRLGSGIDLHRSLLPLEPVLRQVVDELEASQPSRTILCEFSLPAPISFDAGRIGQLVSNLLSNALVHGDAKEPVRLSAAAADGQLTLVVANAGEPIPDAVRARLFQPFFRGQIRASQNGLGLGLHIASEIARAHGGVLNVDSDTAGTYFTFRMPLI
jgi:sigma-B regulation protein RsbU (phosphoserine phosphatase)